MSDGEGPNYRSHQLLPQRLTGNISMANDELADINGVKPKKYLADGEECEAKSQTRYKPP